MRALLIEDDIGTAQSIEVMLKSEAINVYTTDLGEDGIDLGKVYDYDIILLDLNLPDMSGFEVLRILRSARVTTPVLILSGLASIDDKIKGLGLGADDYVSKPFHKDELVARIQAIVRRSQGHRSSLCAQQAGLAERSGQKIVLKRKLSDLGVKRFQIDRRRDRFVLVAPNDPRRPVEKLTALMGDMVRVDVKLLRQLGQRLLPLDRGQSHLCLDRQCVVPADSLRYLRS